MLDGLKNIVKGVFNSKDTPNEKAEEIQVENIVEFKDEIVSFVKNELERRKKERLPYELQWRLNTNFLSGNQYCDINLLAGHIFTQEKMFDWQQREVFNHIAPIIETRLSKLGKLKPSLTVLPATSDLADVNTAKVSKAILQSSYKKHKMGTKISKALTWSETTGSVFYKNTWDRYSGLLIGTIEGTDDVVYEGDILTTVVPCYELFPDTISNELENCRSIIHAKAYSVEVIQEVWNRTISSEQIEAYSMSLSNIGCGGLDYTANVPTINNVKLENSALVIEYWEKPSRKYPRGRLIIVAGDELLYYGEMPYRLGDDKKFDFPFVEQYCIYSPSFFKRSIIERLIPIQRAYNSVKNRKHEYLNRAAIGVVTYEEGTVDEDNLEADGLAPGTMIPRKQGSAPPSFLEYHSLPSQFFEEEHNLENLFILISGVSEISRNSNAPSGAGSGIALSILKESDDTRISLTADNTKNAIIEIGKQWLRLYKQFALGVRMDRLLGENNNIQVIEWKASDITSDDVTVEAEDELLQTPAQKKKLVYDIIQLGLMNDPDTGMVNKRMRSKVLEILGLGNVESIDDLEQLQINRALKENNLVKNGQGIEVKIYDDDNIHIFEHNRFRLSSEYEILEQERPDLAEYMNIHVQLHEQAISLKQMQQQQRMAAMQPQPMPQQ